MAKQLKDEDRRVWRDAMRGVKPLRRHRRQADAAEPPREPASHAAGAPTRQPPRALRTDAKEPAAPGGIDRRIVTRIKRGDMRVDARLDLHGLTQHAAYRALAHFIATAAADGVRLALVITGKGRDGEGVLREAVPRWLNEPVNRAHILAVTPAPPRYGGGGALCVLLRRSRARTGRP